MQISRFWLTNDLLKVFLQKTLVLISQLPILRIHRHGVRRKSHSESEVREKEI